MKNLILLLGFLFMYYSSYSQSYEGKGDQKINLGYEIYGNGNGIKFTYDHGISKLFSVGAGASYYFNDNESDYFIYARTNVHLGIVWDLPCKLDIYPGVELGYLSEEAIGITGYVGFKYLITKNFGLFAEIGNNGSAGLTYDI